MSSQLTDYHLKEFVCCAERKAKELVFVLPVVYGRSVGEALGKSDPLLSCTLDPRVVAVAADLLSATVEDNHPKVVCHKQVAGGSGWKF